MGSVAMDPMVGIELQTSTKASTSKLSGEVVHSQLRVSVSETSAADTDAEMLDTTQLRANQDAATTLGAMHNTVLATRSTDAVIEELNISTKKLKVRRIGSSSSIASSIRSVGSQSDLKHSIKRRPAGDADLGPIGEELEDEDNVAFSGDEGEEAVLPQPTEDQERTRELEVLKSYIRTRERENLKNPPKIVDPKVEDQQSTRWLANNTGAGEIISTAREYQVELFERAKEDNIIAVLDTGSGKTLIAVLLLQHIISQELERRSLGMEKKIAFFLVDSVALVFQQAAVLRCNLNQNVAQICGEMGTDRWSKEPWEAYMRENMVVVLTAEVLYQCLHHSYIKMSQINLLIFDEAHHAKRNHPYARIIKDFYMSDSEAPQELPRIFGMTASPVDARVDVEKAAMELENLLNCRILTSADESMIEWQKTKAKEEAIVTYSSLGPPFHTALFDEIFAKVRTMKDCMKALKYARQASAELGRWAADEVFKLSFNKEEVAKMKLKTESKFHKQAASNPSPIEHLNQQLATLDEVAGIVANHTFEPPQFDANFLSGKVISLVNYLRQRYENPGDDKCIVFVDQRLTARLLTDLLKNEDIGTPHLRVGTLVGTRQSTGGAEDVSFRTQMLTLRRFRSGELNCLFATSVAEEGLDIPDCNLIIRFDLYRTVIQYIQSRGRARLAKSQYLHMREDGNEEHNATIRQVRRDANILQSFYTKLPEDRKLLGNNHNMDYILAKERAATKVYTEPSTQAKLTYRMALSTLANFVGSLTHTSDSVPVPDYVMGRLGNKFLCEVILPEASPISHITGYPSDTKQLAKCSAAWKACVALRKAGHLNEHLVSTFKKVNNKMNNARLGLTSKAKHEYDMRTKPSIWKSGTIHELYLTVMYLKDPAQLGRSSQPIGLLSRGPLPRLPDFDLFFSPTQHSSVICTSFPEKLCFDEERLDKLNKFTLRIFWDVFSKAYEPDIENMSYFIVPISDGQISLMKDASQAISWDTIDSVLAQTTLSWDENTPDSFFEGRFIYDGFDGSRKLWTKKVAHEYKPTSSVPGNTALREKKWYTIMRQEQEDKTAPPTILQYSNSAWKKTRTEGKVWKHNQPVIEADLVPLRRNFLDNRGFPDVPDVTKCFICPEPLSISSIPASIVAMILNFPSIIHRVESYIIAIEASQMLHLPISPELALECLTKDSQNTEDHGAQQVAFQRGMGNNYERLEFYGDCFLKMATSMTIFSLYPEDNELDFHVKRMLMICNQNLMNVAKKLKLEEYIRSEGFNRRSWYPEGLKLLKGNTKAAKNTHGLSDKTIADIPEALIGAALLTPGKDHPMDTAAHAVTEFVCSADHDVHKWSEYWQLYKKPKWQIAPATASQVDLVQQIEAKTTYRFKYPRLLSSAFTHSTWPYIWAHVPNYQRLEFLGDSVLDMVCVRYLFKLFPDKDPQWLTEHKMAMVSNSFLGALCVELGFYRHLQHRQPVITNGIVDYVEEYNEAKENAIKEVVAAGKPEDEYARDFWMHTKPAPKYLADIVEAFIGALFVDSEFEFEVIQAFFDRHIKWFFEDVTLYDSFAKNHPVTALTSFFEQNMGCVKFRLNATQFADEGDGAPPRVLATVMVHRQIVCSAERESARYAKVAVATEALKLLKGDSPAEFREKWGCDCKAKGRVEIAVNGGTGTVDGQEVRRIVDVRMREYELTTTGTESESAGSRRPSVAYG